MEAMSVTGKNFNSMCRLCLSKDVAVINIFCLSNKFKDKPYNIIMKCAPVQITSSDELPNFICQICYDQLEKSHRFQAQVIQSDKTLRYYLQRLQDNQIKPECSIEESSENPLFHNINTNLDLAYDNVEEIFIKSEIKDEPTDDHLSTDDRSDFGDTETDNCTRNAPANFSSEKQIGEETFLKFEVKSDRTNDNSIFSTEHFGDTSIASSDGDSNGINCADTNSDVDCTPGVTDTIEEADKTDLELFRCKICGMYFGHLEDFKRHTRRHSKQQTFVCAVCNKSFKQSSHLITHKRAHTGEKPYRCDVCNKTFSQAGNLNIHKRSHTGKKPYQCDVCYRSFVSTNHLKSHKRIHTGKKPYACVFCHKCFAQLSTLNNHKLILHPGEKAFQCNICNKQFAHANSLLDHNRIHTLEKP